MGFGEFSVTIFTVYTKMLKDNIQAKTKCISGAGSLKRCAATLRQKLQIRLAIPFSHSTPTRGLSTLERLYNVRRLAGCCHTETEVADQTCRPIQSQYTNTGTINPRKTLQCQASGRVATKVPVLKSLV